MNGNGYRPTDLGRIPDDWEVTPLSEVLTVRAETTQPSKRGTMKYAGLEHIDSGRPKLKRWGVESEVRSSKNRFYEGDILYGKLRPYLNKVAIAEWDGMCATDILVFNTNGVKGSPKYLVNLLHTAEFLKFAISTTTGVNHPRTSWNSLSRFTFGLPPLSEQKKIAAFLSKIQQAIEVQETNIELVKELKNALMARLFTEGLRGEELKETEIGLVPRSWELKSCAEICDLVTVGVVVRPASYYVEMGVPAFRSLNIREDRLDTRFLVFFSQRDNNLKLAKSKLKFGDVLVVRTGYPGTACVVPREYEGANCIDLVITRPNNEIVLSGYLSRFFNSPVGKRQAFKAKYGLAQQHLNAGAVKRTIVPIPSIEEQAQFDSTFTTIDRRIELCSIRKNVLEDLFSSVLSQLMTGQMRVNNIEFPFDA